MRVGEKGRETAWVRESRIGNIEYREVVCVVLEGLCRNATTQLRSARPCQRSLGVASNTRKHVPTHMPARSSPLPSRAACVHHRREGRQSPKLPTPHRHWLTGTTTTLHETNPAHTDHPYTPTHRGFAVRSLFSDHHLHPTKKQSHTHDTLATIRGVKQNENHPNKQTRLCGVHRFPCFSGAGFLSTPILVPSSAHSTPPYYYYTCAFPRNCYLSVWSPLPS